MKRLLLILLLLAPVAGFASIEVHQFQTAAQEALYNEMIAELRCLVCQNQNLADSNSELARDLRGKTYELVMAGSSRDEIIEFMVSRYGDFVLYKPPVKQSTLLLWAGPLLFMLLGLGILFAFLRKKSRRRFQAKPGKRPFVTNHSGFAAEGTPLHRIRTKKNRNNRNRRRRCNMRGPGIDRYQKVALLKKSDQVRRLRLTT